MGWFCWEQTNPAPEGRRWFLPSPRRSCHFLQLVRRAGALPSPPRAIPSCQQLPRVPVGALSPVEEESLPTWLPVPCPFYAQTCSPLSGRLKAGTPCFAPSNRMAQFRWLPGPSASWRRDPGTQLHPPQPSLTLSKFSLQVVLPSVCSGPGDTVVWGQHLRMEPSGRMSAQTGRPGSAGQAALTSPGALAGSPAGPSSLYSRTRAGRH